MGVGGAGGVRGVSYPTRRSTIRFYGTSTGLDVDSSGGPAILGRDHGDESRRRRAGRLRGGGRADPARGALRAAHRRGRRASRSIGLAREATPLLGGLAIFGGALVAGLIFLPDNQRTEGILAAAALITIVGALDDVFDLHPASSSAGQVAAAVVLVTSGVRWTRSRSRSCTASSSATSATRSPSLGARAADEHRQLLRRRRRARGRRVRDRGGRVRDHRLRPRAQHGAACSPRSSAAPRSAS